MELIGKPKLDDSILPVYNEYKAIKGNEDLGLWGYLSMRADFDLVAAFSKLFWPDFVEVEGCILLAEAYSPTSFERWRASLHNDRQAIEVTMNETPLEVLFMNSSRV